MKLEQSFEVDAPLDRVWHTLIDVERVAPCLPGAAVTGRNDDGSYNGSFTVKIGPTTASYTGRLEMEKVDESSHTATMQAQGTDKRGQGGAKATILSRLAPSDGHGTRVEVVTDYHITGRLARFGRGGMIEDISERLLREFAKRLQSSLASQPEAAASAPAASAPGGSAPAESVAPDQATRLTPVQPAAAASDQPAPASDQPAPMAPDQPAPMAPGQATRLSPVQPAAEAAQSESGEPESAQPEATQPESAGPESAQPESAEPEAAEPAREADTQILPTTGVPPAPESPVSSGGEEVTPPPPPPPSPGPPPVVTPPPSPATAPPPVGGPAPQQQIEPSEPMQGLSLVGGVVWGRVKRNPAPVAAAGVAVVLLLARSRRRRRHA